MSKQTMFKLGEIYGNMLNNVQVVAEKALPQKKGPGGKNLNDKGVADLQAGGPSEKGGFKPAEIDTNKLSKKEEEDNQYNIDNLSYSDEDEEIIEKISQRAINNFMSKSIFDKLYENVMMGQSEDAETMELDALGIDDGAEDMMGDEIGGEDDQVTITLSKDLAKQLHDVLMTVIGGEEEIGDDEEPAEDEVGEDQNEFGGDFEEDEETLGVPLHSAKTTLTGKDNKVHAKLKPGTGKTGDGKYTDTVDGNAGEIGNKKPDMGEKGNNKVKSTKTSKVGSDFFAA
jgi:hypothetical protein